MVSSTSSSSNRRFFLILLSLLLLFSSSFSSSSSPVSPYNVTVAAFIYDPWTPDFVFTEHGENFTEWELVRRAEPRFPGHTQPHVPLWGEIDTSLPATWDLLNTNAVEHGVTVYLWDWYWWAENTDKPYLVNGLHNGFLQSSTQNLVRWAVMWANQDWSDLMPAKRYDPSPVRFTGAVNLSTFQTLSQYWIDNYFSLPNYYTAPIIGTNDTLCPLVSIYELSTLVQGLGGINATAKAITDFRNRALAKGFPCVHIQVMGFGVRSTFPKPYGTTLTYLGINSVTDYCFQHYQGFSTFPLENYTDYSTKAINQYSSLGEEMTPIPYIPNFGIAWDPSPRTVQSDAYDNWGYPSTSVLQPTPTEILNSLTLASNYITNNCDPAWCMLTVYAYTEFSEGGSLFPTVADGYGRLNAFQSVFGNRSSLG